MTATHTPTVSGPISGGQHGWAFGASMLDVAALNYTEAEYFFEGEAPSFSPIDGKELSRDGFWDVEPASRATFKTRMLVYRPTNPADFNGTVIVTWNNVTAGHDLFGADSAELFAGGFALVCVTTQRAGITGLEPVYQGLANWDPDRYGSLNIPSDDYSFDIFTQAARVVNATRNVSGIDPMGGLSVQHVVAQGASQSAGRLGTYINAIAPITHAFDGYILTIYFGRGTPLEVGDEVVNINVPQNPAEPPQLQGVNLLRDDLNVPIFVVNSELEAIACRGVRQPDTDFMRFWEVAGTSHVSRQAREARQSMSERDGLIARAIEPNINTIPMGPVFDAAFYHMHRWLAEGTPPPVTPRIEFVSDTDEVLRDDLGIAKGGIRLPQADVPLACNSAIPVTPDIFGILGGSCWPFEREQILSLYGDRQNFLEKFRSAAHAAIAAQVILRRDLASLVTEADQTYQQLSESGS